MKAPFLLSINMFFTSLLIAGGSFAQGNDVKTLPPVDLMASTRNVNTKVVRAFLDKFREVEYMKWKEMNKNFFVRFIMNNQTNTALFEKDGSLIYHISYGFEKNLPAEIRKMVKTDPDYFDHNVTQVFNVYQDNRRIWVIYLEDSKTVIHVRVENGFLEEVGRYKKAS
jgi:hypothetical protein